MEKAVEQHAVGLHHLRVVLRQLRQEEKAEHPALAVGAERQTRFICPCLQTGQQALGFGGQIVVKARLADHIQRGQTAGCGNRVAAQSARLIDLAQGRQVFHDGAAGAKSRHRHTAAYDFAKNRNVGLHTQHRLGTAQGHAKTRHHLIHNQQRAVLGTQIAAGGDKFRARANKIHIARNGLDDQAGDFCPPQGKGFLQLRCVVVFQHQGVACHGLGHTCAGGVAKSGQARARLDQQAVRMAVVAALEFEQHIAPRHAPRQTNRAHGRFGA